MNTPPIILLKPNGSFISKYIHRLLTDCPLDPKQRLTEDADVANPDFVIDVNDDHVEIHTPDKRTVTLQLPMVIGTGMKGEAARMARMIYRGIYFHVKGDEAKVSVIHATDVAKAVKIVLCDNNLRGSYAISDGFDPSRHDLAEALAYRLGQKRIYSWSAKRWQRISKWADRLGLTSFDSQQLRWLTSDDTTDISSWMGVAGDSWQPVSTVDYLKTHEYDENSL